MGEARTRRLALVQKQAQGAPITITLSRKSANRLAQMTATAAGAAQVAQQAVAIANGLDAKWREAVSAELDARDVTVPDGWSAHFDAVKGEITASPPKEAKKPPDTPES